MPPPTYTPQMPPPSYSPYNSHGPQLVPAINPHSIPGVQHKVTYIPGPPVQGNRPPQGGYVPQSTGSNTCVVDSNAFDCGARFNQGAKPGKLLFLNLNYFSLNFKLFKV